MEASQAVQFRNTQACFRMSWEIMSSSRPVARPRRPRWNQETLSSKALHRKAVEMWQMLQGLRSPVRLQSSFETCGTRGHCCECGRVFSRCVFNSTSSLEKVYLVVTLLIEYWIQGLFPCFTNLHSAQNVIFILWIYQSKPFHLAMNSPRVESFIEHQDSCGAVKHKRLQSGVESERKLSHQSNTTGRNSCESPSQSSDTTQAISFAQSGTWDTAARSADSTKVNEYELSRRIQENQTAYSVAMPPWLLDRRNQLELLSFTQRLPKSGFSHVVASGSKITGNKSHLSHDSRSQITRCSSIDLANHEVCYTLSKPLPTSPSSVDVNTPSLALSIRPCGTNVDLSTSVSSVDKKRSFSALEKEVLAFTDQRSQTSAGIRRIQCNSLCLAPPGSDLALSIFPEILTQSQNRASVDPAAPEMDTAVSLKDFLKQAAPRLSFFPAVHSK